MTRKVFACYSYAVTKSVSNWSSFSNSPWKVVFLLLRKKGNAVPNHKKDDNVQKITALHLCYQSVENFLKN